MDKKIEPPVRMPGDRVLSVTGHDRSPGVPGDLAPGMPGDPAPDMPSDRAPGTGIDHRSLTAGQMGIIQEFSSQSISGQRPSCHRSLDRKYLHRGSQYSLAISHITLYQPAFMLLMPWHRVH